MDRRYLSEVENKKNEFLVLMWPPVPTLHFPRGRLEILSLYNVINAIEGIWIYLVKLTKDICFMNTEGVSYFDTMEATRSWKKKSI